MKAKVIKFILIGAGIALMSATLGGCAPKTAALDPATQAGGAKADSTAAAQPLAPAVFSVDEAGKQAKSKSGGAGPNEPLDTPVGDPKVAELVVEGSRTTPGLQPVYFDFDNSTIQPEQVKRISFDAQYLKTHPEAVVRIEGNCDERGTAVYNLALGQLRAVHAKNYLVNLGVEASRLTTLSYGEERPVNPGRNEFAWADNRRDDFVLLSRVGGR